MHLFISSHYFCGVLAAAIAGVTAVRVVRDYREYHPRRQSDEATSEAPQPILSPATKSEAFQPRVLRTSSHPSIR